MKDCLIKTFYLLVADVSMDYTSCGDEGDTNTCDSEVVAAFLSCDIMDYFPDDIDGYVACMATCFGPDCHDCLCDAILPETGVSCP